MKKVLILSASYGEGHNAAARGLLAGFEHIGGVNAEMVDVFAAAYGAFYERTRKDYLRLIDRAPKLWAAIYGVLDRTPAVHVLVKALGALESALQKILELHRPAAVVTTYPIYNYLLNRIADRRVVPPFQLFTVVTDSITVNSVWYRCNSDLYFVPNPDTARAMERAGVPAAKMSVSGFPVPPRFALERPERSGIGQGGKVLFMINAGKSRAPAIVAKLLEVPEVELSVTVGRDEALHREVSQVAERLGKTISIYGWTPEMPNLLMTHHLLIGKAGGAAVQETIAAKTPMIITQVVPGQEEGNAQLLIENRCGEVAESPEAIANAVRGAFADGGRKWLEWEQNISRISRPEAAITIAEAISGRL